MRIQNSPGGTMRSGSAVGRQFGRQLLKVGLLTYAIRFTILVSRNLGKFMEGPVGFEPTTPGLKGAPAFLTGSQRRVDTKSADLEAPRYLVFDRVRQCNGDSTETPGF